MKSRKNIIVISAIVLLFVLILFLFYMKNYFISVPLYKEIKNVKGIEFTKANILRKNDEYTFIVTISNNSDKDLSYESFDVIIYNEKGKELETLSGYIGGLNIGEMKEVEMNTKKDLSDIYDVKYKVY